MRVPSLKAGFHKVTLTVDTKTALGVLTAERTVMIEDPAVAKLEESYVMACKSGDSAGAATLSKKLIAARFSTKVKPGRAVPIDKPNNAEAKKPEGFSSTATWYPEADRLRVVVKVTDPGYVAAKSTEERMSSSYVQLFISPSGADRDILRLYMLDGEGAAMGYVRQWSGTEMVKLTESDLPVSVTWDRTTDGYVAEAKIPWSVFKGYQKDWTLLPVEAMVYTRHQQSGWQVMTRPGEPESSARTYSVLVRE